MKYRIIHKILSILQIRFLEVVYIAPASVNAPQGFDVRLLSASQLLELSEQGVLHYPAEDIARIEKGIAICIGAFDRGELAGVCWYARTAYAHTPGYIAHVADDYLCGYGLRVMPNYQGRGVHGVLLSKALEWMRENNKKGILLAINFDNPASIKSALKLGFKKIGYSFYHRLLKGFPKVRRFYSIDVIQFE
jgi:GNAT superfamily N-acetyltransferase